MAQYCNKVAKVSLIFCQIGNQPLKNYQRLVKFAKVVKFRQLWSQLIILKNRFVSKMFTNFGYVLFTISLGARQSKNQF